MDIHLGPYTDGMSIWISAHATSLYVRNIDLPYSHLIYGNGKNNMEIVPLFIYVHIKATASNEKKKLNLLAIEKI